MSAISLDQLNAANQAQFVAALGAIYEHSPWVAEAVAPKRPFATLAALHEAMVETVRSADEAAKRKLIKAHPDLAGKAARAGALTADSRASRRAPASIASTRRNSKHSSASTRPMPRNSASPSSSACAGMARISIFRQFETRLDNDAASEYGAALDEIFRIAALRLDQHVEASVKLKVHGRLSTHVLDTHGGHPAQGVAVELHELSASGAGRLVTAAVTNADGRTDAPLIAGRPLPIGRYELRFSVGDYFARRASRWPIRRFSRWSRYAFPSPSRRATITCR